MSFNLDKVYDQLRAFVRRRWKPAADVSNEDLDIVLDEVGTYIRNYIAFDRIPVGPVYGRPGELFYVWGGMAVDVFRYWTNENQNDDGDPSDPEIDLRDVQTVKLGDTEVKRGLSASDTVSGRLSTQHFPNLDTLVYNYVHQLDQYRKMRW